MGTRTPPLIHVLLFPDVELLDFAGPLEVFTVARDADESPLLEVRTLAPMAGTFRTRHGLTIAADVVLDDLQDIGRREDLLVVPGGFGVRALIDDVRVIDHIRSRHAAGTTVASVCTGAWLLARAGLLEGLQATTHHRCLDRLREMAPGCSIRTDRRVIDCGSVVTSGGISAGIDMALHIVERFCGRERAEATARYMEYERISRRAGAPSGAVP